MRASLVVALLACGALAACSQLGTSASGGSTAPRQDVKLLENIAQADIAEITTGKLAASKALSPAVRQYGQHMVDEHSKSLNEGASLAAAKGMPVPKAPEISHQAAKHKLEALSGPAFDRAYMEQMVKDHQETLALLQKAASQAADPQLRAHAQKALQHLAMAQRLRSELQSRAN
jgi:putative membrane protein